MAIQNALTTEYLRFPVSAVVNGAVRNPTSDTVQFAFPATGVAPTVWFSGSWETTTAGTYIARVLVGPASGVVTLVAGTDYDVWVKITDSPEVPVRKLITITAV